RRRARAPDLRRRELRIEPRRRLVSLDRARIAGAIERRPREELVPGVPRRRAVPLRQERRGPDRVPPEEERRDVREGHVGLLDPYLFGARDRLLEGELRSPLEEPEQRALAQPNERGARRSRVELEGATELPFCRGKLRPDTFVERHLDLRDERVSV